MVWERKHSCVVTMPVAGQPPIAPAEQMFTTFRQAGQDVVHNLPSGQQRFARFDEKLCISVPQVRWEVVPRQTLSRRKLCFLSQTTKKPQMRKSLGSTESQVIQEQSPNPTFNFAEAMSSKCRSPQTPQCATCLAQCATTASDIAGTAEL